MPCKNPFFPPSLECCPTPAYKSYSLLNPIGFYSLTKQKPFHCSQPETGDFFQPDSQMEPMGPAASRTSRVHWLETCSISPAPRSPKRSLSISRHEECQHNHLLASHILQRPAFGFFASCDARGQTAAAAGCAPCSTRAKLERTSIKLDCALIKGFRQM